MAFHIKFFTLANDVIVFCKTGNDAWIVGSNQLNRVVISWFRQNGFLSSTESVVEHLVAGIVVTAMRVEWDANVGGSGQTAVITLRDDNVDTAITVSVASGAQSGSITGQSVAIAAGSIWSISCVLSATTGTLLPTISIEYTVDT